MMKFVCVCLFVCVSKCVCVIIEPIYCVSDNRTHIFNYLNKPRGSYYYLDFID